jgi:lipid-binding SYLF domain-containing protein
MRQSLLLAAAMLALAFVPSALRAADEAATVESAKSVLREIMSIPAKQIPEALLSDAHGVAIVPNVIKVGFIAGVRRGRGVVLMRDKEGAWSLPQFVTLTGGSVGWQAGAQATDVVLVFRTQKSVEGLLRGKFTIGADAEAAAGPVGRRIEAATDAQLKAEIYAYSRSRGLFAGVALDGSALQIDGAAHQAYYGSPPSQPPLQVPEGSLQLLEMVAGLTASPEVAPEQGQPEPQQQPELVPVTPAQAQSAIRPQPQPVDPRADLAQKARQLYPLVSDEWRRYLALPAEIYMGNQQPSYEALQASLVRFDAIEHDPRYKPLTQRSEFRDVHTALRFYTSAIGEQSRSKLALPPPPDDE